MTPQRFQQVRIIFEAALERNAAERAAFVANECQRDEDLRGEVVRLLEANEATMTLRESAPNAAADPAAREGRRLGGYEILRQLGRGGMGSVYLARRADSAFQKNVAIKILRSDAASSDILRRFHQEREILAQLDHPNIARLLDAGETEDGLPYFVMEYVEGQAITEYADGQRLPLPARIALFRQMCDAVDYAHQRKIVHRDLKPGNVLVSAEGHVKLLDFGIARLVERETGASALTRTGMWLMTPEYASPEQVRGEVAGRASDVYSLGVILFELLTGHRPYHLPNRIFHEVVRIVCEEPPTRPSAVITQPVETTTAEGRPATLPAETAGRLRQISLSDLKQQLSGDLDNILLKALNKQPQSRYSSALQFRADIERHMSGEPVWARSDSRLYQAGRLLSRYRIALVVAAVLIAAVASGAVDLRWSVLWWIAGGAALSAVWYAATDSKMGGRIAENRIWTPALTILFIAIGMLPMFGPRKWGAVFLGINVVVAAASLALLGGWLFRSRWTGPLVLPMGESRDARRRAMLFSVTLAPTVFDQLIVRKLRSHQPLDLSDLGYLFWAIAVFAILWAGARQEIRREGFLIVGRLIRWNRIASWAWEDVEGEPGPITAPFSKPPRNPVLALYLHHPLKFLPPVRFQVPRKQKTEVEAILSRQLGEWPAGS